MKKFLKSVGIAILLIIVLFSGYAVISGNTYVFFLLKNTVLKGRLGPTIDEYQIFENRKVEVGNPKTWPRDANYNLSSLTDDENAYHEQYGSAAFVVIRDSQLLFEKYWQNYADTSHTNSWSMAKSIVSHLVGCALKDGLIGSVQDPIGKYLLEFEKSDITIENLLTMSSGIQFNEDYLNPFAYPAKSLYGNDIVKATFEKYPTIKPGVEFDYQSANTELLGFIVMKVTGKSLSEYASEKLWKPIGAEHPAYWSLDKKDGIEKAYCCFNSNALDFAKFGFLYLNHGIVNGDTLISNSYYQNCIQPAEYLMDGDKKNNRYSYQWWNINTAGEQILYARGIQGQYICILPKRKVIIVRLGQIRPNIRIDGHPEDVYKYIEQGVRIAENR